MKQFIVTISQDSGKDKRIRVSAPDKEAAIKNAMASEGCYLSDIVSVGVAAYKKLTHEEIAQKKQDSHKNEDWQKHKQSLENNGTLLSDFQE
jgi:hypothetical protein